MTGPQHEPEPLRRETMEAAEADLAHLRETLMAAGRGEVPAPQLREAVASYVQQHGSSLQAAAAEVGEETRRQMLVELYKWRDQLNAQLDSRPGTQRSSQTPTEEDAETAARKVAGPQAPTGTEEVRASGRDLNS